MESLASVPRNASVRIRAVGGEPTFRRRLLELGFLPGVEVKLLGAAPLGDPIRVEVRGCRFSIRRTEARAIHVVALDAVRLPVLVGVAAAK